jgi:hypothetical protein
MNAETTLRAASLQSHLLRISFLVCSIAKLASSSYLLIERSFLSTICEPLWGQMPAHCRGQSAATGDTRKALARTSRHSRHSIRALRLAEQVILQISVIYPGHASCVCQAKTTPDYPVAEQLPPLLLSSVAPTLGEGLRKARLPSTAEDVA